MCTKCDAVEKLLGAVEQTPMASFSAFEAVAFVFEFAATYLVCLSRLRDQCHN